MSSSRTSPAASGCCDSGVKDSRGSVQSVLVLGGGSEIALATVRELVARRATTVGLAARRPDALDGEVKELRELARGRPNATIAAEPLVAGVFARFGDFDVVLIAFGVLGEQSRAERDGAAAVEIARVNYLDPVGVAVPVANRLRAQGHGTIVVLSSVAGERARRSNFVYGSTKAGLDPFFQGLGDALVGTGASVMIGRPGFVHTEMTSGLAAAPGAVAEATGRGLERGSEIVWVPPALRWVMTVLRHLPRPLFRKLPL